MFYFFYTKGFQEVHAHVHKEEALTCITKIFCTTIYLSSNSTFIDFSMYPYRKDLVLYRYLDIIENNKGHLLSYLEYF